MNLQFENPISLARKFKGAPLAVLWVLYFAHQRVSQSYLQSMTGYTDKTISSALQYLKEDGVIEYQRSGWILGKGIQLEFPSAAQDEECRKNSDPINYLSKEVVDINNLNKSSTDLLKLTPQVEKIPMITTGVPCSSDEAGDSINRAEYGMPMQQTEPGIPVKLIGEIQMVLDAAADLFGHPIMGDPRDYSDLDRLLAWIAQAYQGSCLQGKLKVNNPAGLIYWAFHQGKDRQVDKKYQDQIQIERYLPGSFIKSSGQWEFEDDDDDDQEVAK